MSKKKDKKIEQQQEEDLTIEQDHIEVANISFTFPMTRDEASEIVNKPKGQIARKLRTFMYKILKRAAEKFLETGKEEDVTNCKVSLE